MMKNYFQYFYGIIGQVTSGLPLLIITAFISNEIGLTEAGQFTVTVGLASSLYTIFLWGLRPLIVLNENSNFDNSSFFKIRILMLLIFSIMLLFFSHINDYLILLTIIIILFKLSDGMIDLYFAFMQKSYTDLALREFGLEQTFKFSIFIAFAISSYIFFYDYFFMIISFAGVIYLVKIVFKTWNNITLKEPYLNLSFDKVIKILYKALPFALSASVCGVLSGSPRFILDNIYSGEMLGVVGISLSIGTLFGMIFNTTWARYFPLMKNKDLQKRIISSFLIENLFFAAILIFCSYTFLPYMILEIFSIDDNFIIIVKNCLIGFVVFSCGMSSVNLFKITNQPILESVIYFITLIFFISAIFFLDNLRLNYALMYCGLIMQFSGFLCLVWLKNK